MPSTDDIRIALCTPSEFHGSTQDYALPMLDAIEAKAAQESHYACLLNRWLSEGGTVLLRDDLCDCFRRAPFVIEATGPLREGKFPYAFADMWMALDSARHALRFSAVES